jgi:hypothetical protein
MLTKRLFLLGSMVLLVCASSAFSQGWSFSDANVDYGFELPDTDWKLTVRPNAASIRSEFVYRDRRDGLLEIRKIASDKSQPMADVINDDEQKHQQFLQGFVAGKIENFAGRLKGSIANFEFVAGGRNMSGRYYFLRADNDTVYVLRFTGPTDGLRSLRVHTDQIARSFRVKTG